MNNIIIPLFIISIVCIILSIPLLTGKIKRNHSYGFRFKKALETDEYWIKINKYGAIQLLIWSFILFVVSVLPKFISINKEIYPLIGLISSLVMIMIVSITTYLYSKRI